MAFCAALSAALVAHVAIDVVGDYVLARDAYDGMAHASRTLVAGGAMALLMCALGLSLHGALAEARGNEGRFCRALATALPRSRVTFAAVVTAGTFVILGAMGGLDTVLAAAPVDDISALFGGSLTLAAGLGSLAGLLAAALVWHAIGRLGRMVHRLARAILHFVRFAAPPRLHASRAHGVRSSLALALIVRPDLAGRAPPRLRPFSTR